MGLMLRRVTGMATKDVMRMRVASACGDDGQMRNGDGAKLHGSTGAMNELWTEVADVGGDNAVGDGFHKFNTAGSDATKQSAMFQTFIDVLKQQEYMSAMGQGKELRIGSAEYLGKRTFRQTAICGDRKTGGISGMASEFRNGLRFE